MGRNNKQSEDGLRSIWQSILKEQKVINGKFPYIYCSTNEKIDKNDWEQFYSLMDRTSDTDEKVVVDFFKKVITTASAQRRLINEEEAQKKKKKIKSISSITLRTETPVEDRPSTTNDSGDNQFSFWKKIEQKFDSLEKQIRNVDNGLNKKIDSVVQSVDRLDKKIDNVANDLDQKIDNVANDLNKKIDSVAQSVDCLEKKVDNVANNLDKKIASVEKKITSIYELLAAPVLCELISNDQQTDIKSCKSRFFHIDSSTDEELRGFTAVHRLSSQMFETKRKALIDSSAKLNPRTSSIQINFWVEYGSSCYGLVEGTMSDLMNDDIALAAKLLQLERQIVFSSAMMNRNPDFIGFVSPSFPDDPNQIRRRMIEFITTYSYTQAVPFVNRYILADNFKGYKVGAQVELL